MPNQVKYILTAISNQGLIVDHLEGISDNYSVTLEQFQERQPARVVRITADLILPDNWKGDTSQEPRL